MGQTTRGAEVRFPESQTNSLAGDGVLRVTDPVGDLGLRDTDALVRMVQIKEGK